jgi:hypothetical protein
VCVCLYAYFTLAFLLLIPKGSDRAELDSQKVWWQLHACGPSTPYHVYVM